MTPYPAVFRRRFIEHNCWAAFMAALSFLAALILWNIVYFFFILLFLGFATIVRGDIAGSRPEWIDITAASGAIVLFVWGTWDRVANRFERVTDRKIIGFHLVPDVVLLPVRLTFGIWGNLSAILSLRPARIQSAWNILCSIAAKGKLPVSALTLIETDPTMLHSDLKALQLLGCIDLHVGAQDWFYTVRSSLDEQLQSQLSRC